MKERRMKFHQVPLLALSLLTTVAIAQADTPRPPERLAHFDDMPKVSLLPDGTLAAFILRHRGPGLPDTEDVQRMRVRESRDNGKTWGDARELFALPRKRAASATSSGSSIATARSTSSSSATPTPGVVRHAREDRDAPGRRTHREAAPRHLAHQVDRQAHEVDDARSRSGRVAAATCNR
jgi:hypothetical protein